MDEQTLALLRILALEDRRIEKGKVVPFEETFESVILFTEPVTIRSMCF